MMTSREDGTERGIKLTGNADGGDGGATAVLTIAVQRERSRGTEVNVPLGPLGVMSQVQF